MQKTPVLATALGALFAASCFAKPAVVADKAPAQPAAVAAAPAAKPAPKPAVKAPAKAAKAESKASVSVVQAAAGAKLTVNGDSTMHKWHTDAQSLTISAEASGDGDLLAAIKANGLNKLSLVADAASLHSPEGSGMDKNTRKTLEADKYPQITFTLASYTLNGDKVEAKGSLSIHGVAKDVVLTGTLTKKGEAVNVKGSYDLKMTDYGVTPPVMMLGTVKVADALSIAYDFDLAR
jgi:polyisoprenoid-binding protein YceI